MKNITVDELKQKLEAGERLNVVDVREQDEYDAGHIPGVRFLPMSEIGERYTELQEGETYYIICAAGGRSENVSRFLDQYGYDIVNVQGGMSSWTGDIEA
ncbi:rhodanese-like domain-containing protein [Exiguobacterium flavidum]|uniref:rhodanese-like domain-containing protein n=1 Tax=Exiguobacterium flavidum TaxID=2184695 RepID=UPI000DF789EC|nr:rhodanese-like domain-containing protein [Exiguobacterium flavidum]